MAQAAQQLGIHFNTLKSKDVKLGCYKPNKSGKGIGKKLPDKYSLKQILNGEVPHFQTYKLRKRILKEQLLEYKCAICGISEWRDKPVPLELDHVDGNSRNHRLHNLRLLCPNCHSQTDTFRSKNRHVRI